MGLATLPYLAGGSGLGAGAGLILDYRKIVRISELLVARASRESREDLCGHKNSSSKRLLKGVVACVEK